MRYKTGDSVQKAVEANLEAEFETLKAMVDDFAGGMKDRLGERLVEGVRGWDDPNVLTFDNMRKMCIECVNANDLVDAANWLAFMWNRTHG